MTESYSYLKEQAIVLRNMVATATAYESKKGAERAKQAATAAQVPTSRALRVVRKVKFRKILIKIVHL